MDSKKKLFRVHEGKMWGGVLAGVAEYTGWDVSLIRLIYVFFTCCSLGFGGVLAYILACIIIPYEISNKS